MRRKHSNNKSGKYSSYESMADKIISGYKQFVETTIKDTLKPDDGISIDSLELVLKNNIDSIVNSASAQLLETMPSLVNQLGGDPFEVSSNIREIKEYWKSIITSFFSSNINTEHISKTVFNMSALYIKNGYPSTLLYKGFKMTENAVLQFLMEKNKHYSNLSYYQFVHSRFNTMQSINKQAFIVAKKSKITKYHYIDTEE